MVTDVGSAHLGQPSALELGRLLAHDCRTPLNAIAGLAEIVLGGEAGPLSADALDHVRQIARAGRALADALDLAREVVEPDCDLPLCGGRWFDATLLLRALGCRRTGDAATVPIMVHGDEVAWQRIAELCRRCLEGTDGAVLAAEIRPADDGGVELALRRADLNDEADLSVLGIYLAQRSVARQGARLRVEGPGAISLLWSKELCRGSDRVGSTGE